jgi:peptidoglycan hydrolase-like protein with peptidoglycan-binding domain
MSRGNGPIAVMSQAQVRELQQLLAKRGFDVGKIDGVIGEGTREAVRQLQIKFGMPADSYPTVELLARLKGGA